MGQKMIFAAMLAVVVATAFPAGSASAEELQAREDTVLDGILRQEHALFMAGEYPEMAGLSTSDLVEAYAQEILASGSDRYICDIDGTIQAMLYVPSKEEHYWYFGTLENGLRHGNGTTLDLGLEGYTAYEGSYAADMPDGRGTYFGAWFDDGSVYAVSGIFKGAHLNGTYQVDHRISTGEISSIQMTYQNDRLARLYAPLNSTGLDGTGYVWYEPDDGLSGSMPVAQRIGAAYTAPPDMTGTGVHWDGLFGNILSDIPDGRELFAFGIYQIAGEGYISSVTYPSKELDEGLSVLRGRGASAQEEDPFTALIGHIRICGEHARTYPESGAWRQAAAAFAGTAAYVPVAVYGIAAGIPDRDGIDTDDIQPGLAEGPARAFDRACEEPGRP